MSDLLEFGPRELAILLGLILSVLAWVYAPTLAAFGLLLVAIWVLNGTIYGLGVRAWNWVTGVTA